MLREAQLHGMWVSGRGTVWVPRAFPDRSHPSHAQHPENRGMQLPHKRNYEKTSNNTLNKQRRGHQLAVGRCSFGKFKYTPFLSTRFFCIRALTFNILMAFRNIIYQKGEILHVKHMYAFKTRILFLI